MKDPSEDPSLDILNGDVLLIMRKDSRIRPPVALESLRPYPIALESLRSNPVAKPVARESLRAPGLALQVDWALVERLRSASLINALLGALLTDGVKSESAAGWPGRPPQRGFFCKARFCSASSIDKPHTSALIWTRCGVSSYSGVSSAELQLSRLIRHVEPHGILHGTTVDGRVEMVPIGTTSPSSPAALSWGSHNTNTVSVISI